MALVQRTNFGVLLFILLSFSAQVAFAQSSDSKTASTDSSKQPELLVELPESVLNTELQLLGGKTLKLSEYSGKVVLINLFATWCGPCRYESPDLAKLYREFKDRGLVVIELSVEDPQVSNEVVREWVWDFRLPHQVGWTTKEFATTLMEERQSIPQAFLISRDGRILKRFIGYDSTKTFSVMRVAVAEALK